MALSVGVCHDAGVLRRRVYQVVLLTSLSIASWMGMMLIHEAGHVFAAVLTGGVVERLIWHPLTFSRTEVDPNPRPLIVAWSGPLIGAFYPWIAAWILARIGRGHVHLVRFFAGFCLIANGVYIGLGWIDHVGDAGDLVRLGTPLVVMIGFGIAASGMGLWEWHRASPDLGFGQGPVTRTLRLDTVFAVGFALFLVVLGFVVGDRGA